MKQRKRQPKTVNLSLKDYLDSYDSKSITAVLETVNMSLAWDVLRSYLRLKQREFEVASLDMCAQDGNSLRAAKASGVALGFEETAEKLIPELIDYVNGRNGVVETPRPE